MRMRQRGPKSPLCQCCFDVLIRINPDRGIVFDVTILCKNIVSLMGCVLCEQVTGMRSLYALG
jgi:hypothetical protein